MDVIVLGGGVIGISTAYYLARAGAQVTVLERQPGVALETSFANAGQVSAGYATPWAAPGIPAKAAGWLFQRHAPLAIRPDGTRFQLRWMWEMYKQCTPDAYAVNKTRMMRLAEYSRDRLRDLRAATGVRYEGRSKGTLQLFRSQAQVDAAARDVEVLKSLGVEHQLLRPDELARIEPALHAVRDQLTGGLHLPNDETGDCHLFTRALADEARALGVEFRFGVNIQSIETEGQRIAAVVVDGQRLQADHVVLAMGSYSRELLLPLGLDIPVYPLKGYSLTVPIVDETRAPVSTILDETYKIAVTRFDERIRVGGMAEIAGFDLRLNPRRRATLEMVVNNLFPGAGQTSDATFWTGLRPMTPDGTPIIGATPWRNLWTNTGHGTLGWTMACGSGQLLADLMAGRVTAIDPEGLSVARYQRQARKGHFVAQPAHHLTRG